MADSLFQNFDFDFSFILKSIYYYEAVGENAPRQIGPFGQQQ